MEERLGKALWMKYEWCGGSVRNARRTERRVPILPYYWGSGLSEATVTGKAMPFWRRVPPGLWVNAIFHSSFPHEYIIG